MALQNINPTQTNAWNLLERHYSEIQGKHLKDFFRENPKRFEDFHIQLNSILFDFSKNRINQQTIDLLINLANECKLKDAIQAQFCGEKINKTENRSVLHTALRKKKGEKLIIDDKDIIPEVHEVLDRMQRFSNQLISGEWKGFSQKPMTDIVNIGIGGSDLGPVMATEALKHYKSRLNMHFVSNVDGSHLMETLKTLNPETTLFIIASKTFSTQETMTNAQSAKDWFLRAEKAEIKDISKHFIALSTNKKSVIEFGIDSNNMFHFWNWVGGRYSLWSAVGLSVSLAVGYENFLELLAGANEMDEHFYHSEFDENIPVILGLLGIWYHNFFQTESHAILPYEQYLHRFVAYLQQADMESNGKTIDRNGNRIDYHTGPIIWGEPGTNGQHAFYQLIHQGSKLVSCDFIAGSESLKPIGDHQKKLLSNFIAQTQALAFGKSKKEVIEELKAQNKSEEQIAMLTPYKIFKGNIPTNSILYKRLTPKTLGSLIAMYEHKIFVQGVIWNIYSYDQWGVELGKKLAGNILPILNSKEKNEGLDSSSRGLIDFIL